MYFFIEKLIKARSYYYKTDVPSQVAGNVWLRVWVQSSLVASLEKAFAEGKPVDVTIGMPHTSPDGQKTSTVKTARVIYEP